MIPSILLCDFIGGTSPPVINKSEPVFSWASEGTGEDAFQTAFQLWVFADIKETEILWGTGKVLSPENLVKYAGIPLRPYMSYFWKLRLWDQGGQSGTLSELQQFKTGSFEKRDNLKVSQSMVSQERISPVRIEKNGIGSFLADFGRDAFAGLEIAIGPENGREIEIILGEALAPDGGICRPEPRSRECNRRFRQMKIIPGPARENRKIILPAPYPGDEYQSKGYDNRHPLWSVMCPEHLGEVMPFRYCEVRNYKGILSTGDIAQLAASYRFDNNASSFTSSDPNLNTVWDFCKYSIKATTPFAVYIDGDRERQPYGADAYVNQLSHYCCAREYSMARNTMEFFFEKGVEWGYESILSIVLMAWTDYMYTGDIGFFAQYHEKLKAMLFPSLVRSDGLIVTGENIGTSPILKKINARFNLLRDLVDWPPSLRDGYEIGTVNTSANSFLHSALNAMVELSTALGKTDEAALFLSASKRLKKAAMENLFNPQSGLFVDSEGSNHSSLQANIHAVAFGLARKEDMPRIIEFIISKGMSCGPWNAQFLLEVMFLGGAAEQALALMTSHSERGWLNMLRQGATITMECWNNELKPNQDWNHAWSTAPANIIARHLMGIRPLTPGFGKVLIRPRPGNLKSASITLPCVRGDIKIAFAREAKVFKVELVIPGNMVAETNLPLCIDKKSSRIRKLFVDGLHKDFRISGDGIISGKLLPGRHELIVQT